MKVIGLDSKLRETFRAKVLKELVKHLHVGNFAVDTSPATFASTP